MLCREPTPNDASALARLHVCAWQIGYRGLMPDAFLDGLSVDEAERRWSATVGHETSSMLVAEERGEVLGACRFGKSSDGNAPALTAEIYSLNVHPSAWGQGIGRGLLTATADRLALLGFSRVTLWVIHGNARARTLYERFGFAADGAERTTSDLIGVPLREVRYSFTLHERSAAGRSSSGRCQDGEPAAGTATCIQSER
jgi:RimJ/RimL family protein N-acetyltransferase